MMNGKLNGLVEHLALCPQHLGLVEGRHGGRENGARKQPGCELLLVLLQSEVFCRGEVFLAARSVVSEGVQYLSHVVLHPPLLAVQLQGEVVQIEGRSHSLAFELNEDVRLYLRPQVEQRREHPFQAYPQRVVVCKHDVAVSPHHAPVHTHAPIS